MAGASSQVNAIFALSLLLTFGYAMARLAQLARLPSVTGYIVAGILLGPVALDVVPHQLTAGELRTFTDIALMLVAFGIGERLELARLRAAVRAVVRVGIGEVFGTFVLVGAAVGLVTWLTQAFDILTTWRLCVATAIVSAAIAVATAPASTVAVIREMGAAGPVSRLLLSAVAVNNAASILLFGLTVAAAHPMLGVAPQELWLEVATPFAVAAGSLALGLAVGLITDAVVHRLTRRQDVLIVALGAVFFCGGLAQYLGFSAMLSGLAAGFALVNRDRRDVRAFRAINDFEPPIYGIFFALAGVQLHLSELISAGAVGIAFVLARAAGKVFGAWIGARGTNLSPKVASKLGLGLLSQAGLAIGLAYLVQQDEALAPIRSVLINIVVASVVINELVGPPLLRWVLSLAGEGGAVERPGRQVAESHARIAGVEVVPWTWPKLQPPDRPHGVVIVGVHHPQTARGLTRIAILLANYYRARPLAVCVLTEQTPDDFWGGTLDEQTRGLFTIVRAEGEAMGYPVETAVEFASDPALGLISVANSEQAHAVVLGHPLGATIQDLARVVDHVGAEALCPVVVAKLQGPLHTERILVPITSPSNIRPVLPVVAALAAIEHHEITLLHLLAPDASAGEEREAVDEMRMALAAVGAKAAVHYRTMRAEARVLAVSEAAADHDVLVMPLETRRGLRRLFVGSMAEDVAVRCVKPILMVRGGIEDTHS